MALTLDQILTLAGRLDDEVRFDAPRERFRRFVTEYASEASIARHLIEQGQHVPSDQHQRAIQDLVTLSGRFLGFTTSFASDLSPRVPAHYGRWHSPSRLHVLVQVRSDHRPVDGDEELLLSAVSAMPADHGSTSLILCVITPLCMTRHKIEAAFAAWAPGIHVAVLTLNSLLLFADAIAAGRMTHDDVVRLFETGASLDFIANLLNRAAEPPVPRELRAPDRSGADEPACWMSTVAPDYDTKPEEFLELVVARRMIFGIGEGPAAAAVRPLDRICFYIAGTGVVGHARIVGPADAGRTLRDAHRFKHVLQLTDVRLYLDRPVAVDVETQLRFRTARLVVGRHTQTLMEISRQSFEAMTRSEDAALLRPVTGGLPR